MQRTAFITKELEPDSKPSAAALAAEAENADFKAKPPMVRPPMSPPSAMLSRNARLCGETLTASLLLVATGSRPVDSDGRTCAGGSQCPCWRGRGRESRRR